MNAFARLVSEDADLCPEKLERPVTQLNENKIKARNRQNRIQVVAQDGSAPALPRPKKDIHSQNASEHTQEKEIKGSISSKKWSRRKIKRAVMAAGSILLLFTGLFLGAYWVAEPWVAPFDLFNGTQNQVGDEIELSVGQSATIQVPLGENERIQSIEVNDSEILQLNGTEITALGAFLTTVTVTTAEIQIPQRQVREVKLFGWDLSETVDSARTWLRALLDIEQEQPPRTELRVLNVYQIPVNIVGYNELQGDGITAFLGSKGEDPTNTGDGQQTVLLSDDQEVVKTYLTPQGASAYEAIAVGNTELHSRVGFWKNVAEDEYKVYLDNDPQMAEQIEINRAACAENETEYPYDSMVFVTQFQVNYEVSAEEPPEPSLVQAGNSSRPGASSPDSGSNGGSSSNPDGGTSSSPDGGTSSGSGGGPSGSPSQPQVLLELINAARVKEGLQPLVWSAGLAAAAEIRVYEITELMSHTRPNGKSFYTVNPAIMYGENLAAGIVSAQDVFDAWMNSPGHRANILQTRYRTVGYAYLNFGAKYWYYWALEFGL